MSGALYQDILESLSLQLKSTAFAIFFFVIPWVPAEGVLNLAFENEMEREILIFNVEGKLVELIIDQGSHVQWNCSENTPGIYAVHIKSNDGISVQNVIVR